MQTIYNAQGEAKECEAVDAREHIESGRWFNEAPKVEEVIAEEVQVQIQEDAPKRAYNKKS